MAGLRQIISAESMLGGPSDAVTGEGCARQRPSCHITLDSIFSRWDHSAGKPSIQDAHAEHVQTRKY
jgi:hypothetical protein